MFLKQENKAPMKKGPQKEGQDIKNVIIVAGEASGDMHGAVLVKEMMKLNPALHFHGIGGNELKKAGVEVILEKGISSEELVNTIRSQFVKEAGN